MGDGSTGGTGATGGTGGTGAPPQQGIMITPAEKEAIDRVHIVNNSACSVRLQ